jgi:transcriptional regulator with XRE-family HTH domain
MTMTSHDAEISPQLINRLRADRLPPPARRREIRKAARATLLDVATELGVTQLSVSNWERGLHEPRRRYIQPYRRLLEVLAELAAEEVSQQGRK